MQSPMPPFFHRRVYKAAKVTRVGGLPSLRARVTLAGGGLTFSLVNTPDRVNPPKEAILRACGPEPLATGRDSPFDSYLPVFYSFSVFPT